MRRKPRSSKKSRMALTTSARTRRTACCSRGPEPEMAVLHQERGAVLLERDRVLGGDLDDLDLLHGQLEAARGPLVLADSAPDDNRGLLGQPVELLEEERVLLGAEGGRLDDPRAVADEEEADLARRALVVDPAADLDVLAVVGGDVLDVDPFHSGPIIGQTGPTRKPGGAWDIMGRRPWPCRDRSRPSS